MPKAGLAFTNVPTVDPARASLREFALALALLMVGLTCWWWYCCRASGRG